MGQPSRKQIIWEVENLHGDLIDLADTYRAPLLSVGITPSGGGRRARVWATLSHEQLVELADVLDKWLLSQPPVER